MNIVISIPTTGSCANPTSIAGTAPIYGPTYGIKFVMPHITANNNGFFKPIIAKPIKQVTNINKDTSKVPIIYSCNISEDLKIRRNRPYM